MTTLIGKNVRGYEIIEELGRGGYGVVYRAYQKTVDREVAIKVILPEYANQPEFATRFDTEARLVAQLEHPHILPLFDYWQDEDEGAFLVMRYVRGGSMRDRLKRSGALTLKDTIELLDDVLDALAFAHQQGVIHRDIKPDNILLDELGNAYLADFGVAKAIGTESTADGTIVGTIAYLSPEQLRGDDTTAASDIYSVGIMIYELLAGEHPFSNISVGEMVFRQMNDPIPLINTHDKTLDEEIDNIIQRATLKDSHFRYNDVATMRDKLRDILNPPATSTQTTAVFERDKFADTVAATREARNRKNILLKVDEFWIQGVLENSLHGAVMVELEMHQDNTLSQSGNTTPFGYKLDSLTNTLYEAENRSILKSETVWLNRDIIEVFDDFDGNLLILGEPGGGKTTTLLSLARSLLMRAHVDEEHAIPIIFNLSSWQEDNFDTFEDWLQSELRNRYQVPPRVAQNWVENDELILLLDGLDEVPELHRESCVQAINLFRQAHGFVDMAICSRLSDYSDLTLKLNVDGVLSLQPLTMEQVNDYLVRLGHAGKTLRRVLANDSVFHEMATNPLMLSILTMAYLNLDDDAQEAEIVEFEDEASRRTSIFKLYVQRMFERRTDVAQYAHDRVEVWLSWLAQTMKQTGQSLLQIELIQPHWLGNPLSIWMYRLLVGLTSGLVASGLVLITYFVTSIWAYGFAGTIQLALAFIPAVFLIVSLSAILRLIINPRIAPVDDLHWSTEAASRALPRHLVIAILIGIVLTVDRVSGFHFANFTGWIAGLSYLLAFGMLSGFVAEQVDSKTVPNEGLQRSVNNSLHVPAIILIAIFIPMTFEYGIVQAVEFAPVIAIGFGVVFGPLNPGGEFVVQHLVLRLLLWLGGKMPAHYADFLNYASSLIFVRKVGGGYVFVHRYLLEYFAKHKNDNKPN